MYRRLRRVVSIQTLPAAWGWVRAGALRSYYNRVTAGVTPFAKPNFTRAALGGLRRSPLPAGSQGQRSSWRAWAVLSAPWVRSGTAAQGHIDLLDNPPPTKGGAT